MSNSTNTASNPTIRLSHAPDIELETLQMGQGEPLLILHGFNHLSSDMPWLHSLATQHAIIAPSHPGFGQSPAPRDVSTVYDLVHTYIGLIHQLPHESISLLGHSFGGWLAAEIAVKLGKKIKRLILVDALGIKISGPMVPDIFDIFNKRPDEVRRRSWHDPDRFAPNPDTMTDQQLMEMHRNWESLCRYGWQPFMYNPQLKRWLSLISAPTQVIWGASDGIVSPAYGRAYADLIPHAQFHLIEDAGHYPQIEQPEAFSRIAKAFLKT
jgi:pimeloyl-ACP methyl ester carboxylesterase